MHGEDRCRRLDHSGQACVEARLGKAEQPEGDGVVERAEDDERDEATSEGPAALPCPGAGASEEKRAEDEPSEHDHRRLEHLDPDLDEEERRPPDRGEEQEEEGVATRHRLDEGNAWRRGRSPASRAMITL